MRDHDDDRVAPPAEPDEITAFARAHRGPRSLPRPTDAAPPPELATSETIALGAAFAALSTFEFAYFVRLMTEPATSFRAGRKELARRIGVPLRNLDRALKQLERKSFLIVEGGSGPGKPSRIHFLKRIAIVGPTHFAMLASSVAHDDGREEHAPEVAAERTPHVATVNPLYDAALPDEQMPLSASDLLERVAQWRPKTSIAIDAPEIEVVAEDARTHATSGASSISLSSGTLNRKKLEQKKREKAELLRGARAKGQLIAQARTAEAKRAKKDYAKDAIAFRILTDPKAPEANHARTMLERAPNEKRRARLSIRLGSEFRRIYTRVREKYEPDYQMSHTDFRNCEAAAASCVRHRVSPEELIEYWRVRVPKFTSMAFPLVRFLAGDARAEEVAISKPDHALAKSAREVKRAAKTASGGRPAAPVRNDFERPRDPELHARAKAYLTEHGKTVTDGDVTTLLAMVASAEMRKKDRCTGGPPHYNELATMLLSAKHGGHL